MRLENLELVNRTEAQLELFALAAELETEGFVVEVAPEDGSFHAKLQESADHVVLDVINVVLDHAEGLAVDATILAVAHALRRWAPRRRQFRGRERTRPTAVIWGSDGDILSEVELPDPDPEL